MDERVNRRSVFQRLLIEGVDSVSSFLSQTAHGASHRDLTPEEAGLLLRSRKPAKKGPPPGLTVPAEQASNADINENSKPAHLPGTTDLP